MGSNKQLRSRGNVGGMQITDILTLYCIILNKTKMHLAAEKQWVTIMHETEVCIT